MISITGKLFEIVQGESTNQQTGEVSVTHSAEVLHKERGKNVITSLKLDDSVLEQWTKNVGQDFTVEVRPWAMKTREGGIQAGYALADKKSLPVLLAAKPALKAA
jgi:hypothetical protein